MHSPSPSRRYEYDVTFSRKNDFNLEAEAASDFVQSLLSVRCRREVDRLFSWPLLDLFDCCKSCNTHLAWWGGSLSGAPPTQGASRRSASRPVAPPRASTPPELLPRFGWLARRLFFSLSWDCFRRSRVLCGSEQWKSREGVGRGRWAAGVRGRNLSSTTSRSSRESSTAIDRCASRDGDGSRGDGSRRGGRNTHLGMGAATLPAL